MSHSVSGDTPNSLSAPRYALGWLQVGVAALAMVGTLPGRTQGLGLITEPLLKDLGFSRIAYAQANLWATLIGALFAIGIGQMIDRFGSRMVLVSLTLVLGVVVVLMAQTHNQSGFSALLTLTRGIGQSALSVASLALVGKWFVRRLNVAMALFSVLVSMGFMIAFPVAGALIQKSGWRIAWSLIGWALLAGVAPLAALLARRSPEACGLPLDGVAQEETDSAVSYDLGQTLRTPAFWVIGIASACYGLIASGIGLFNQSILEERGFPQSVYHTSLAVTAITSLAGNFLGGWITAKRPLSSQHRLMSVSMALLAGSLIALAHVKTQTQVMEIATVLGIAGGFVLVIFFSYWTQAFGRAHLGRIQGVAQALTVLASAVGPLALAQFVTITGSYAGGFYVLALFLGGLAVGAWLTPVPSPCANAAPSQAKK